MTWPAYTEYKESDVEWIGAIPCDWSVRPLRYICDVQTGDRDTVHRVDDGEYPFFIRSENVQRIDTWSMDGEAVLTPGDGAVGQVFHYYVGKFDYHQRVYAFFNFRAVSGRYFYYYLSALFAKVALDGSAKTTVDSLRMPLIKGFMIAHPGLLAQEQIVRFLDRETAKIDALIDKQEQLIATLREDRAATINEAVTRGIDPHVELVDSNVRWLREIPAHWDVISSRRFFKERKQRARSDADQLTASQKYGVIPQKDFVEREGVRVTQVLLNPEILKQVEAGDFVISMRSFQGGIEFSEFSGAISSAYVPLVPSSVLAPEFYRHVFKSAGYIQALQSTSNLVRDGQALRFENFSMVPLPCPPRAEQHGIATHLDRRCAQIDALISKSTEMIETLREYRSALITNAVTGKIDVREAV